MKTTYHKLITGLKRNKWIILLIPIYLVYYMIVNLCLGMGDDIWDEAIARNK